MAKDFTFKMDSAGFVGLMRSDDVEQHLRAEAEQIAAEIGPQFQARATAHGSRIPVRVVVDTNKGQNRAAATVLVLHPAALRIEAEHGYAASALKGR